MKGPIMRDSLCIRVLRRLANVLLRGRDAEQVRADLDEGFERDLERGVPRLRAAWRYAWNALASAFMLRGSRLSVSWLDVKLGSRMLLKHPGLTAVSVFALAIGIPVGLAPSWLADAVEAPLPHPDGDRVRALRYWDLETTGPESATWYDYTQWRAELTSFESLGALRLSGYNVAFDGAMGAPVPGAEVTASTFGVLRAAALHGRVLFESDEAIGGPAVVVIGHALWRARFGGDPDVIGRDIRLAGVPHTVVGVMPESFRFPLKPSVVGAVAGAAGERAGPGVWGPCGRAAGGRFHG